MVFIVYLISFNIFIFFYMFEIFLEYSNEGCNVVWCFFDIIVFFEESVVFLYYIFEVVN